MENLRKQNKKFKRKIKALKRRDGGKDYDSGEKEKENEPSDAVNVFGGPNKKKANKQI